MNNNINNFIIRNSRVKPILRLKTTEIYSPLRTITSQPLYNLLEIFDDSFLTIQP